VDDDGNGSSEFSIVTEGTFGQPNDYLEKKSSAYRPRHDTKQQRGNLPIYKDLPEQQFRPWTPAQGRK